ncbi:hypothetical protein QNO07_27000 [Streptomyces sp. 549]|uniref:hypothetical protein n=1 Tax=Streptomyces sp. 549 TaxID=3049076 RepID=UPI0024C28BB4|nr:hypothetical protein [Streptomyces sp. 549]MDK1476998.1 hypothetical protein [Streptomyces sp. 549]
MTTLAAVLSLSSCGAVGDLDAEPRSDSRRFDFSGERLIVDSGSNVRLVAGDGPGLAVSRKLTGQAAEKGNAAWKLAGDTLRLTARCTGMVLNCSSEYTVHVPAGVTLTVRTQGADVTAESLPHRLTVRTESGRIKLSEGSGDLRLRTRTGRVDVIGSRSADVRVRSHNADHSLTFSKPPRRLSAHTGIGDIAVTLPKGGTRYRIDGRAQDPQTYRVDFPSHGDASHRIAVESPEGRVRVRAEDPGAHR